jgi:hypothetical protein
MNLHGGKGAFRYHNGGEGFHGEMIPPELQDKLDIGIGIKRDCLKR